MNYYELLGIDNTSSSDEIKKSYRKLASQHHPDKGGTTEKFQEIQAAYDTLSDPQKRAQYDQELAGGGFRQFRFHTSNSGMGPDDFGNGAGQMNDILNSLFRQFGGMGHGENDPFDRFKRAHQQRNQPKNRDVKILVPLDLASTLEEQTKTLNIALPGGHNEDIEIKIPRGVNNGVTIRYPGLGDYSVPNAPRADLYVHFHIPPKENFEQAGIDLVTRLTINCIEAMVGSEKEVTGLDEKIFKINIPPGTQYGSRFGIPEQGLYSTNYPGRGKLIVIVEIYVPQGLTTEQVNMLKSIQPVL